MGTGKFRRIAIALGFCAIVLGVSFALESFYGWITVFAIPGWLIAFAEYKGRLDQERLHAEMVANTLPDGSYLFDNRHKWSDGSLYLAARNRDDDWTLTFPAGSGKDDPRYLHLDTKQVTRLREAWRIAVAEVADKICASEDLER
jgi:hypothetical protein